MALQKIREGGHNPDTEPFVDIRGAATPMRMWIELFYVFRDWHRKPTDRLAIGKIYEYARWCIYDAPSGVGDAGTDPPTAAVVCFFEHIPHDPLTRPLIGEFMSPDEVRKLKAAFTYHIGEEGFDTLLREVRESRERTSKPRVPPHRRNSPIE
jgi:hypothetical protein